MAALQLEGGVMSELALLEAVQERMQQTLDVLVKAGQWTVQTDEGIRFLIESGGLEVAEQRIAELRELLDVWQGTIEFKERAERVTALEKALANARTSLTTTAPSTTAPSTGQRGIARPQSRLRVDNTESIRESGSGLFSQIRQNIGR